MLDFITLERGAKQPTDKLAAMAKVQDQAANIYTTVCVLHRLQLTIIKGKYEFMMPRRYQIIIRYLYSKSSRPSDIVFRFQKRVSWGAKLNILYKQDKRYDIIILAIDKIEELYGLD